MNLRVSSLCVNTSIADHYVANEKLGCNPVDAPFLYAVGVTVARKPPKLLARVQILHGVPFYPSVVKQADTLVLGTSAERHAGAIPANGPLFASTRSVLTRSCKSRSPEHGWMEAPM